MNNPDSKFIPVLDHIQDRNDEEDYNIVTREMMPMEGESVFESMIRSRHVISERILRYITNKDGSITPESLDMVIGQRAQCIIPKTLPHGIISILDGILSYVRKCAIEDGLAVYHEDHDYGMHEREYNTIRLSDMHVATHAIVVGTALILSDQVINVSDKSVFHGSILEASHRIDDIEFATITKDSASGIDHEIISCLDTRYVSSHVMRRTSIGRKIFKELHDYSDHIDDDIQMFSVFSDIGVMELCNVVGIDPIIAIIRYCIEMCKEEEHFFILHAYSIGSMDDMIEMFGYIARSNIDRAERLVSEFTEYDNIYKEFR